MDRVLRNALAAAAEAEYRRLGRRGCDPLAQRVEHVTVTW
jgi:hypothetical protein